MNRVSNKVPKNATGVVDFSSTALLVVDVQNDFMPWGALPVPQGDKIIKPIQQLFCLPFKTKIAVADWHPADHCSFATRWGKPVGERIMVEGVEQRLWPDHCVQGSWGAQYVEGVQELPFDRVFRKGFERDVDSYSAFFNAQTHSSTGLDNYLKESHCTTIVVAGLTLEYCVFATAQHARQLGYRVVLVEEAIAALAPDTIFVRNALAGLLVEWVHIESLHV